MNILPPAMTLAYTLPMFRRLNWVIGGGYVMSLISVLLPSPGESARGGEISSAQAQSTSTAIAVPGAYSFRVMLPGVEIVALVLAQQRRTHWSCMSRFLPRFLARHAAAVTDERCRNGDMKTPLGRLPLRRRAGRWHGALPAADGCGIEGDVSYLRAPVALPP